MYEWEGSDASLKPLLLAAHQGLSTSVKIVLCQATHDTSDVVPVDPKTVDEWQFPPYSGFYDGQLV